jgi:NTF2 fold immunity protein
VLKLLAVLLIFVTFAFTNDAGESSTHPDYVPDEVTAEQIAKAVLVAQFGQERVMAQLPLHTVSISKDQWLVQGALKDKEGRTQVGGGFGVWVNKHTGCVSVVERTK